MIFMTVNSIDIKYIKTSKSIFIWNFSPFAKLDYCYYPITIDSAETENKAVESILSILRGNLDFL